MRIEIHIHEENDEKVDLILSKLDRVITKEDKMDADIQAIVDQAQKNTDAEAAADAALVSLFTKLQAAIAATGSLSAADRTTLQTTVANMAASSSAVAAAIVANTPAA